MHMGEGGPQRFMRSKLAKTLSRIKDHTVPEGSLPKEVWEALVQDDRVDEVRAYLEAGICPDIRNCESGN